jgi:hypothetical protein
MSILNNVTNMRLRDHGTTFFFLLMQVAMSGTCVLSAQPLWIETILGVCCSGRSGLSRLVLRDHVGQALASQGDILGSPWCQPKW